MNNYIIVDDDEMQIDLICTYLNKFDHLTCIGTFTNPLEARAKIMELEPDLLFLDIEMPDLSGIQLIKSLKKTPEVIFITSHKGFALDAFDMDAIDYLVKPVAPERLMRALDKFQKIQQNIAAQKDAKSIDFETDAFFIRDQNHYKKTYYKDVLYIESSGNFSFIHSKNGEKQIVLASLSKMDEQLPENQFIRISRSHIVNKQYVQTISTDQLQIENQYLTIGKLYSDQVIKSIVGNNAIKRH